jgi:lysophospholipase L1-like esterase
MMSRARRVVRCLVLAILVGGASPFPNARIALYCAGDSTMAAKTPAKRPETGWCEALQEYFRAADVRVINHAANGRSTSSFIAEGRWQRLLDSLAAGDYVFIQFGHNDEPKGRTSGFTTRDDFRAHLTRMVSDVRAQEAVPVLLTPVYRRRFDTTGVVVDSHEGYDELVRGVAAATKTPLIDMHRLSARVLAEYGEEGSRKLFLQLKAGEHPNYPDGVTDNTHFSPQGARAMAAEAVRAIREQRLPLAAFLVDPVPRNLGEMAGRVTGQSALARE